MFDRWELLEGILSMLQALKLCLENRNGALFVFSISSIVTCLLTEQSWSLAGPNSNLEFRNLRTRERRIHKKNSFASSIMF